ncbi:MGH1-like glycoside hydrolase domain-containing protein [Arthrobacter sp. B2a2-09]|uniref:MGH1-like glycoside hydrolase domain-containing protein n=1 Tax=Arthrobacter sp. B2a2-09 TaxID=2952822 RepID=UPI0022CD933F|nr:glucosidase [Arthrobacter sp. B2a2-09]MCZ9880182.1 glucosidase [Arthrobacter sp. B2a2-09]
MSVENDRLAGSSGAGNPWRLWGPYLSARQWGTVREDYSADGDAWNYFPFDQSHARAYRWGEDGLGGFCDIDGYLNFSVAMWNGHDDRLKERLFGLTNGQGNHGEDVKEYWWPVDATPSHSFGEWLYRYPQRAFPYERLIRENAGRSRQEPEFELADTGMLAEDRFFDVAVCHAKAAPDDVLVTITATNHGPEAAPLDLLPQLWFTNTWAWGRDGRKPVLKLPSDPDFPVFGPVRVEAAHHALGGYVLAGETAAGPDGPVVPRVLFCDNETDDVTLFGTQSNASRYPKDGINKAVVHREVDATNPENTGTKTALWYHFDAVPAGGSVSVNLRLRSGSMPEDAFGQEFDGLLATRRKEADEFYAAVIPSGTPAVDAHIARRAFAGLLWGKQLYRYAVEQWLEGDPAQPAPPAERRNRTDTPSPRNLTWPGLELAHVISMPDEWEYPWFAAWDLAFHCVPLAHIDPVFAKDQLMLLCREYAMHPNGQLPAYEWALGDVNPPVQAWAAWQVYQLDGGRDTDFLIRIFTKLLLNFSWWINRKDADGNHIFEGGFLGMDNIGLFDRSAPLAPGYRLEQSDATSWMAFYCLAMMRIALELARTDPVWEEMAITFLDRFSAIAQAMENFGSHNAELWDDEDGFFYDVLIHPDGSSEQLRIRSMVGLLPLLAVCVIPEHSLVGMRGFRQKLHVLQGHTAGGEPPATPGSGSEAAVGHEAGTCAECLPAAGGQVLSLLKNDQTGRLLRFMLDDGEFLAPHGLRALSAAYRVPFSTEVNGQQMSIHYTPGESDSALFGGNSNWRGPIWFPINVLLADALKILAQRAGCGLGAEVEFPTGSSQLLPLSAVADALNDRLVSLFRPGPDNRRPGTPRDFGMGPLWDIHPTFSEYFHGDTGAGLGASHQTGWTALVAHLICVQQD